MPVTIGATYFSIYKLLPHYLVTKRYFQFGVYSLYTLIMLVFGVILSAFFAIAVLTDFKFAKMTTLSRSGVFIITCVCLVVIIVSAFKLLKLNLDQSKQNAELEAKILEAQLKLKDQELKYLKMQIHPHFLFNTLNTIYGYALKKSGQTHEMILKLSNLLDYLLYQVEKPLVALTDEINHIEDYIALEELRFSNSLAVSFKNECKDSKIEVAPMLFLPFVENSFKHGSITNGKLSIDVEFSCSSKYVNFKIKNSFKPNSEKEPGLGLANIKKRLNLLYKDNHTLNITNNEHCFYVELMLQLDNSRNNV